MEILKRVLVFLKVGAVSFGGGWTIVGLLREEIVSAGLMGEDAFQRAVAIAQITPGPVALNVATLAGWETAGWIGSVIATLSVLAVPIAAIVIAGIVASRLPLKRERLAEALAAGALAMTAMTAVNIALGAGPDVRFFLIVAASFALNAWTKVNPAFVILGSGAFALCWDLVAERIAG